MSSTTLLRKSLLAAGAFAALLSSSASAQVVDLRGKVEDVSGTANQFVVGCAAVQLTSSDFDLNLFVGQQVLLQGDWNGSASAPAIDVTAIQAVAETFEIGGGAKLGGTANFQVSGTPGDIAVPAWAKASGFLPLGGAGSILLDLGTAFTFPPQVIPALGQTQLPISIPSNPVLLGLEIFGQAGVVSLPSGFLFFTNPDCKTIGN